MKYMMFFVSAAALVTTGVSAEPVTKTVATDRPDYTATRVVVRDKEAGTLTRDSDVVRKRDGAAATSRYSRTQTDTGYTANRNIVNGNGRTLYDRDVSVSRSNGNVTRSVDVTRAKGFRRPQGVGRGIRGARRR